MKLSRLCAALTAVMMSVPQLALAETPTQIKYIEFFNKGAYTIDNVWIKWKDGDKTRQYRFAQNLSGGAGLSSACYDLSKIKTDNKRTIPDGAEVWLVASIQAGETVNCRKDTKHYYNSESTETWQLRMGGETYTNNRCKNGIADGRVEPQDGNSKKCPGGG